MGYYRYEVPGGEFVLRGDHHWQVTFNGVQIGGLYRHAEDALAAIGRRRRADVPGPDLSGIEDPPLALTAWNLLCAA